MAVKRVNYSVGENARLLEPCWIAGGRKNSAAFISKCFSHHEIENVDVAGSCLRICDIIDNHCSNFEVDNALGARNGRIHNFRAATRLTFGVSYILRQQVCTLLANTERLLADLEGNKFSWDVVKPISALKNSRKRKNIISTTTISVVNQAKKMKSQLLDDHHIDYFRDMLTESQLWQKESAIMLFEESIQLSHTYTEEHIISIANELILTEIGQDLMCNDGFGETKQDELTAFTEFLPLENTLNHKSLNNSTTDFLCYKKSRLEKSNINLPNNNLVNKDIVLNSNEIPLISISQENIEMSTTELPAPVSQPPSAKTNRRLKAKIRIDKCHQLSRKILMKHRYIYNKRLYKLKFEIKPRLTNAIELVNSFKQVQLFPGRLKTRSPPTSEEMELVTENTVRAIFGDEYSDALATEILSFNNIQQEAESLNVKEVPTPPETNLQAECSNNNVEFEDNHFDAFKVMDNLLTIWRNDSNIKTIDVNQYLKTFPDRIKAALAFSHLLILSRDGFIKMSTKPSSVEVDAITLGVESIKLIENIIHHF